MNQLGDTTPIHLPTSHSANTSGAAIVVWSNLTPEQENAILRQQLEATMDKNRELARIIDEQEGKISEQTLALRRESQARYALEMKLHLSELVSDNVERILTDLNRIEVTDAIGFFDYLMNQLPEELDCGIRYFIPPSTLEMDVLVQNGRKADIFVELLDRSYAEIQIIRESKWLPVMEGVLFHDMPKWDDLDQRELFPIQIDDETVGYIEFMRDKRARKLVPDIRPQFHRVMRLISSHLDRIRYETVMRENERILQENMSLLRAELHTDVLTGISNRRGFFAKTERMLLAHPNLPATLIAIDIDFFKRINDTYGHAGGDSALRAVAQSLKAMLGNFMQEHQSNDDWKRASVSTVERRHSADRYELGRLGGEEFAIQIVGVEYQEVEKFAETLRQWIKDEFQEFRNNRPNMEPTSITISVGVAPFTERLSGEAVEGWQARILDNADAGLYHAKHNGRDQVVVFDEISLDVLTKRKLEAESKSNTVIPMRSSVSHAAGDLYYRPATTRLPHAEALMIQSRIRSRIKKANHK